DPALSLARREQFFERDDRSFPRSWQAGSLWWYAALLLESVGRIHDARINLERAVSLNPFDVAAHLESALLAGWLGNIDRGRDRFEEMGRRSPNFGVDYLRIEKEWWSGDPDIAKSIHTSINLRGRENMPA